MIFSRIETNTKFACFFCDKRVIAIKIDSTTAKSMDEIEFTPDQEMQIFRLLTKKDRNVIL